MKFWKFIRWKKAGPGLITGSSDDDPSGIITYTQAGASFGHATLWTAWLSLPLMIAIQEMCARIGLIQRRGLAGVLKQYYPRPLLFLILFLSIPAIILNIGSNLSAMGAVCNLLFPTINPLLFSAGILFIILWLMIRFSYKKIALILKWLCLSLLVYAIVPFLFEQNFKTVFYHTFIPKFIFTKEYAAVLVGILGTTISPYLFFWQTSAEKEEILLRNKPLSDHMLGNMRTDVRVGMIFSNLIMYFILLAAATVFFPMGIYSISTVEDAATALKPLAGGYAYLLFAAGIIGTGMLSIPVLAGSVSYMIAETMNWKEGLDKKFHEAKSFYLTLILTAFAGFGIYFFEVSPVQALLLTAIVYGVIAPVLIAVILHICNNQQIMGKYVNSRLNNLIGIICFLLMSTCALVMIYLLL